MSLIEQLANNLTATLVAINDEKSTEQQRKAANQQLQKWGEENRGLFMLALAAELANEQKPVTARQLAGIMLKNVLHAKEPERKNDLIQKWLALDQDIRTKIKQAATMTFSSPVREARVEAANVVSKIALIEIPRNMWPGLIQALIENMKSPNAFLRQSTVITLGELCEGMDPTRLDKSLADQILTAVVHGMIPEERNDDVKLAACNALYYGLEFAKRNFEVEEERQVIMNVILEACTHPNPKVRVAAYEVLVKIASLYYEYLAPSMQRIFNLTLQAIRTDVELVAQQAIEFWSTICDEEIIILDEAEEAKQYKQQAPRQCLYYIKGAANYLVPVLTEAMTKGDKSTDAQQWNIAMAAGSCLNLIAITIGDDVVPPAMNFILTHWNSQNIQYKETAIFAFGSIMDGPTKAIRPLITDALPSLIQLLKDPSITIKDTTAWTISKICQFHPEGIGQHLPVLVKALVESLGDDPRVSSHVCWAIVNLAQAFQSNPDNSPFNQNFIELIRLLLHTASREDASEAQLALQAYEAINALIASSGNKNINDIEKLVPYFLDQLDSLLRVKCDDEIERQENEELQGLLCGTLMVITQKLGDRVRSFSDLMMAAYLKVIQKTLSHPDPSTNYVHEDALMAIGSLANVLGMDFDKHMKDFHQIMYTALGNWQDYQVCNIAVGVVGDVARAIGTKLIPYCEKILTLLLNNLQNPNLDRSVKPSILSCFGDIALAVGGYIERWLPNIMNMLQQASTMATKVRLDQIDDLDLIDYINQLREGIFEAYTGIIQGLRTERKADILIPYVPTMIQLIGFVWNDQLKTGAVTRGAIGLLGDLAHSLGPKIRQLLQQDFVNLIISSAIQDPNQLTREVACWTKDVVTQALS